MTVTEVYAQEISESDRMNGVEWVGQISFQKTPSREAGDPGIAFDGMADINLRRQKGQWTQWVDYLPEAVRAQKVKGQWQIEQDTWLMRGKQPTAADFANAGVK